MPLFENIYFGKLKQENRCAVFASPVRKNTRQAGGAAPVTVLPGAANLPSAAASARPGGRSAPLLLLRPPPAGGRPLVCSIWPPPGSGRTPRSTAGSCPPAWVPCQLQHLSSNPILIPCSPPARCLRPSPCSTADHMAVVAAPRSVRSQSPSPSWTGAATPGRHCDKKTSRPELLFRQHSRDRAYPQFPFL